MMTNTDIANNAFRQTFGSASRRSGIVRSRGIGVLAAVCGGLLGGRARAERAMVGRLSRGLQRLVRPEYRQAA